MTRLGLIVPSTNTVAEVDFQRGVPEHVSVHTARMYIDATTGESERRMVTTYLPAAARDIATIQPDVCVFACTSAGAVVGADREADMVEDLSRIVSAPVVSTNAAVHKELSAIAPSNLAVLTPYIKELTTAIRRGIESAGMYVSHAAGMGFINPFAIAEIGPNAILDFAIEELSGRTFDALFVSCTNLPALHARPALENYFGVPVLTSNQAALYSALEIIADSPVGHDHESTAHARPAL